MGSWACVPAGRPWWWTVATGRGTGAGRRAGRPARMPHARSDRVVPKAGLRARGMAARVEHACGRTSRLPAPRGAVAARDRPLPETSWSADRCGGSTGFAPVSRFTAASRGGPATPSSGRDSRPRIVGIISGLVLATAPRPAQFNGNLEGPRPGEVPTRAAPATVRGGRAKAARPALSPVSNATVRRRAWEGHTGPSPPPARIPANRWANPRPFPGRTRARPCRMRPRGSGRPAVVPSTPFRHRLSGA